MTEWKFVSGLGANVSSTMEFTGVIEDPPLINGVGPNTQVSMLIVELPIPEDREPVQRHRTQTTKKIGQQTADMVRAGRLGAGIEVFVSGYLSQKVKFDRGTPPPIIFKATSIRPVLSR